MQTSANEIAWGFRKLLETRSPLVVVFDDIQWAEETFLELIEHIWVASTSTPLLVVCLARPELVDRRPDWDVSLSLEPLPDADVEELVPSSLTLSLRERIIRVAGGNPLYVTEMAAMAAAAADPDSLIVPPTLKGLLAARLDRLPLPERLVLGFAAV